MDNGQPETAPPAQTAKPKREINWHAVAGIGLVIAIASAAIVKAIKSDLLVTGILTVGEVNRSDIVISYDFPAPPPIVGEADAEVVAQLIATIAVKSLMARG